MMKHNLTDQARHHQISGSDSKRLNTSTTNLKAQATLALLLTTITMPNIQIAPIWEIEEY